MNLQLRSLAPPSLVRRLAAAGTIVALVAGSAYAPVAAQPLPDDVRTILVTGTGTATAPAETARIQFLVGGYPDFYGMDMPIMDEEVLNVETDEAAAGEASPAAVPGQAEGRSEAMPGHTEIWEGPAAVSVLTDEDLEPLVDALIGAGVDEDAITVVTGPGVSGYYGPGGPPSALIEALVDEPTLEQVNTIVDAVSEVAVGLLALQQVGVEYNVADCAPLLEAARQAAADDARARAEALAPHFGAMVGAPVQVYDYGSTLPPIDGGTGCPPGPEFGYIMYGPTPVFNTPMFNPAASAEARVMIQFSVTFELELASQ